MALCMPEPTMVIPSAQMIAVDHPRSLRDDLGRFTVVLPCHEWSYSWLRMMATCHSLPHLHVTVHCMEDYGKAFNRDAGHPAAAGTLFIGHMQTYGYPPLLRRNP
jgi:hypothetical protein